MGIIDDVANIKPKYKYKLDIDKNITFGTEIEFENASFDDIKTELDNNSDLASWHLVHDYTVECKHNELIYGGEVVSPILTDTKQTWIQLKKVCTLIKNNIGLTNDKAGAHIHIGLNIFDKKVQNIFHFLKIWIVYEHIIYHFAYGEKNYPRKTLLEYASPIAYRLFECIPEINSKEYYFQEIIDYICDISDMSMSLANGFSFSNGSNMLEKKDTIEIRCPNGTLNEQVWQNNISFFVKLLLYSCSSNFDDEFMNYKLKQYKYMYIDNYQNIYLNDALELMNFLYTKEEDKLSFLKQYLKINRENVSKIKKVKMPQPK